MSNKYQQMIRVNHAGEYGATLIYKGQIDAFKLKKDEENLKLVKHMKEQEDEHFAYFDKKIKDEKIRPTLMHPIWKVGGYALGFATALIDKKAAMTCTTAVEEVIDEHYQEQLNELNNDDSKVELKNKIKKFRDEELEHRDIGYEHMADNFIAFKPLSKFIKMTTKTAIAISKRI